MDTGGQQQYDQGTSLDALDNMMPGGSQEDAAMNAIYADINGGGGGGGSRMVDRPGPPQQRSGSAAGMIYSQQPNTATYPYSTDPAIPTAHQIGRDQPNPAEFANMMAYGAPGQGQGQGQVPSGVYDGSAGAAWQRMTPPQRAGPINLPTKGWSTSLFEEARQPILVAVIMFFISLPAINILFFHYAPFLLRAGGDYKLSGLAVRAALAGLIYWFCIRVVSPLIATA